MKSHLLQVYLGAWTMIETRSNWWHQHYRN